MNVTPKQNLAEILSGLRNSAWTYAFRLDKTVTNELLAKKQEEIETRKEIQLAVGSLVRAVDRYKQLHNIVDEEFDELDLDTISVSTDDDFA